MIACALAVALAMEVQGTIDCPSPTEISQHLLRLVPGNEASQQAPRARLADGDGFVTIQLENPEGALLAERRLDRLGSCAEMAEAVAVILAAWQATFDPKVAPLVIEAPAKPPAKPVPPPPPEPRRPIFFDVGLAALSSFVGSQPAFGGKLEAVVIPFAHGLGANGSLSLSSDHTQDTSMPTVRAEWGRKTLSVGPLLRLHRNSLALDIHGNAVLALLAIKGRGVDTPASDTSAQFGLAMGARGLWTGRTRAAWLGATLLGFPGQDNLTVGNRIPIGQLPHLEFQICLGIAIGQFR